MKREPKNTKGARKDKVRETVVALYSEISMDWKNVSERIADVFRRETTLGPRARAHVVHALHGLITHARRIDFALEHAASRRKAAPPHSADTRYAVWQLISGHGTLADAAERFPQINWQAVVDSAHAVAAISDPVRRLAIEHSLPDWLAQRFHRDFREEAFALAAALNERGPQTVRVNTLKTSREELLAELNRETQSARPAVLSSAGIYFDPPRDVFKTPEYAEGLIEIQDEGSQLIAEITAPAPGSLVIDACAGAGGKTLALGALMQGRGRLIALDINARRLDELRRRCRRAGLSNVQAVLLPRDVDQAGWPEEIRKFIGKADRVLVDAPCSGIGAVRRNPEAKWRLSEEDLARFATLQLAIARHAAELVKPGGRLIYATCTLLREENEQIIEQLTGLHPVPLKEIVGRELAEKIADSSGTCMKLLPHRTNTDGFFAAVLRRKK
ncbi:MAG TPA: RsmB/NOP family class I SAM-dependent RNA methyltransferase [Planctomycetota bacterium]|nr:RsmB/NOP family class I SAM-dependent RNA methyltransferase [Planctomycetota bacterium]